MKVLVRKDWKLERECTGTGNGRIGCGSTLEVSLSDLRYFAEQEFPWRTQPEAVCFKCPVCNAVTDLPKNIWPPNYEKLEAWSGFWRDSSQGE